MKIYDAIGFDANLTGSFTGSFTGDGSGLTGIGGGVSSYADLTNVPSGIISSSIQLNNFDFTGSFTGSFTGDGSSLTGINNVTASFSSTGSISVDHNFNTKAVIVQVYDNNDFVINPSSIKLTSVNQVKVSFSSPESGMVVVGK